MRTTLITRALALLSVLAGGEAMALGMRTLGRRLGFGGRMSAASRGAGRGVLYQDITETIGNTPVVKISDKLCPPGVEVYAKCEYFNPLSSVKDRLALAIIEDGEKKGLLKPGDTVVEATSGNTGIAVAMVCAQRGYKCVICMAEPFSVERRKLMRMLGAKVIVTPKAGKGTGMVRKAEELAATHGWFLCHQFETEANWQFHEATTGPEILNDFDGKKLDYWVTGCKRVGARDRGMAAAPPLWPCLPRPRCLTRSLLAPRHTQTALAAPSTARARRSRPSALTSRLCWPSRKTLGCWRVASPLSARRRVERGGLNARDGGSVGGRGGSGGRAHSLLPCRFTPPSLRTARPRRRTLPSSRTRSRAGPPISSRRSSRTRRWRI